MQILWTDLGFLRGTKGAKGALSYAKEMQKVQSPAGRVLVLADRGKAIRRAAFDQGSRVVQQMRGQEIKGTNNV